MKDVFISYTTKDRETAYQLVNYLEDRGVECYIAPRDVNPGKPYASQLMDVIGQCSVVLLVASEAINASEHVLNEVDAICNLKKPLLPIIIEDFEFNNDYRYYLGRKQWVTAYPQSIDTYFSSIYNAMEGYLPTRQAPAPAAVVAEEGESLQKTKTVFEYIPERGIMINPEDHQRNVSFRTDTFINMMGGIYEKVAEIADEEAASEIFFRSGYVSGKNFADRINSQWDTGYTLPEIQRKLAKWCEFDSAVGWGHFSASIDYTDENGLSGTLTINEPFVVDTAKKRKVCSFIRGYCEGVLETLLGNVNIALTCRECPLQSRFKCSCVFDIKEKQTT